MSRQPIIIIRSIGERTTDLCAHIARQQADDVLVIEEKPFVGALRKMIEIAILSGKKWLIALDADELLAPHAIDDMVRRADMLSDDYLGGYGVIACKFLLRIRVGVPRIYRISMLDKLIIKDTPRPEQDMAAPNLQKQLDCVTAIHDWEQYYRDIYRKMDKHGWKYEELNMPVQWKGIHGDMDYVIALNGIKKQWQDIKEKPPIRREEYDTIINKIPKIINEFR